MTHAELVARAAHWLQTTIGCGVVLVEHGGGGEVPDVIGWTRRPSRSYVVECKVSRADFLADLRKPSRQTYSGRPAWRCYYLTPRGLLWATPPGRAQTLASPQLWHTLPAGWGLAELADGPRSPVRVTLPAAPLTLDLDDRTPEQAQTEIGFLYREVRRYHVHGITYPPVPRPPAVSAEEAAEL